MQADGLRLAAADSEHAAADADHEGIGLKTLGRAGARAVDGHIVVGRHAGHGDVVVRGVPAGLRRVICDVHRRVKLGQQRHLHQIAVDAVLDTVGHGCGGRVDGAVDEISVVGPCAVIVVEEDAQVVGEVVGGEGERAASRGVGRQFCTGPYAARVVARGVGGVPNPDVDIVPVRTAVVEVDGGRRGHAPVVVHAEVLGVVAPDAAVGDAFHVVGEDGEVVCDGFADRGFEVLVAAGDFDGGSLVAAAVDVHPYRLGAVGGSAQPYPVVVIAGGRVFDRHLTGGVEVGGGDDVFVDILGAMLSAGGDVDAAAEVLAGEGER